MLADSSATRDPLKVLLDQWNGQQSSLDDTRRARLLRLSRLELGLPADHPPIEATTTDELADALRPVLPVDDRGRTLADVFGEVRDLFARRLHIPATAINWGTEWSLLNKMMPKDATFRWGTDPEDILDELLTGSESAATNPVRLVGEIVRCMWEDGGGVPFWRLAPYEVNWCASQGVFHDVRQLPELDLVADRNRIEPATPLASLVRAKSHGRLLESIEERFGVWLGHRAKEGWLPVMLAGVLASPLGMFVAVLIAVEAAGRGTVGMILMLLLYAGCISVAVVLYFRSQPRLPGSMSTVKEMVRAIVAKRRQTRIRKQRIRPITLSAD